MSHRYIVIDSTTNLVLNAILWDGITAWSEPDNTYVVQSDTIQIDDTYTAPEE